MSCLNIKESLDFFERQQGQSNLRWQTEVADRFSKLLGSGYVKGSIRSLWQLYPEDRRIYIRYLLEMAENWRTYLQKQRIPDPLVNVEALRIMRDLLQYIENPERLPSSSLFSFQNGHVEWLVKNEAAAGEEYLSRETVSQVHGAAGRIQ